MKEILIIRFDWGYKKKIYYNLNIQIYLKNLCWMKNFFYLIYSLWGSNKIFFFGQKF